LFFVSGTILMMKMKKPTFKMTKIKKTKGPIADCNSRVRPSRVPFSTHLYGRKRQGHDEIGDPVGRYCQRDGVGSRRLVENLRDQKPRYGTSTSGEQDDVDEDQDDADPRDGLVFVLEKDCRERVVGKGRSTANLSAMERRRVMMAMPPKPTMRRVFLPAISTKKTDTTVMRTLTTPMPIVAYWGLFPSRPALTKVSVE
jgi:hypothetical protein